MRIKAKETPAPGTDLAVITSVQAIVPSEFFKAGGSKSVLDALKEEVRKQAAALDISTETGRKAIASLAYKVARSKTALEEQGKALVVELKAQSNAIDKERAIVWGEMEALQVEVRKPLTDWENAEKARIAAHEDALSSLRNASILPGLYSIADAEVAIELTMSLYKSRKWEEFEKPATESKNAALYELHEALEKAKRAEEARIEAELLAAEARERAIKEREEAAAKSAKEEAERKAAEQARIAQEAAERERRRIENERIEAEARAKQAEAQRVAAEREAGEKLIRQTREAEIAAERAAARERQLEQERLDALQQAELRRQREAEQAERRAKEAAEKAERDRQAAIEAERARVAEEKRKEAAEAEARARDKAHKAEINREALAGLVKIGMSADQGKIIIAAIAKGEIPHVRIEY